MKLIYCGLSAGKYKNPFLTLSLKRATIVFEYWIKGNSPFFFRKTIAGNMIHVIGLNLSITIFRR